MKLRISFWTVPNGKKPGPDGLPAAFLKRYCHQLAIIFQEAWIELASGRAPIDHVRVFRFQEMDCGT